MCKGWEDEAVCAKGVEREGALLWKPGRCSKEESVAKGKAHRPRLPGAHSARAETGTHAGKGRDVVMAAEGSVSMKEAGLASWALRQGC